MLPPTAPYRSPARPVSLNLSLAMDRYGFAPGATAFEVAELSPGGLRTRIHTFAHTLSLAGLQLPARRVHMWVVTRAAHPVRGAEGTGGTAGTPGE